MRRLFNRRRHLREERGAVLALTAIILTVVLLIAAYVIDEGIWFVHRQHLQTEADAAALAAAHDFQYPCSPGGTMDQRITGDVHSYDGTTAGGYNPQVLALGGIPQQASPTLGPSNPLLSAYSNTDHDLFSVVNRPNFFNQSVPNDTGVSGTANSDGSPCSDAAIDVKLSETNLPSVFPFGNPAYVNAQARVSIEKLTASGGAEPFVEPMPSAPPSAITATLVDESNNNTAIAGPVTLSTSAGNPWTFTGLLPSVTFPTLTPGDTGASHAIGLQLCYQGGACYESGGGAQGVTYTRVWATAPSNSTTAPPQVNDITVQPAPNGAPACPNPSGTSNGTNFTSTPGNCTMVVQATNVTIPTVNGATCKDLSLTLTVGTGAPQAVPCPVGNNTAVSGQTWVSSPVTVAENGGQMPVTINWKLTSGAIPTGASGGTGGSCSNSNPCTGTLGAQRINSGAFTSTDTNSSNSGSITAVALTDQNGKQIMSVQSGTPDNNVKISVSVLSFQPATSFSSPLIAMSFAGNQANAAISCNGNGNGSPAFFQSIVTGCSTVYQTQPTPGSCPSPPAYSSPPSCAGENPGNGKLDSDLGPAMNCRINGSGQVGNGGKCNPQPSGCVNPNHWTAGTDPSNLQTISQVLSQNDPRLIFLPITNNSALINGSANVPIISFATFYVTGWSGGDPCIPTPPQTGAGQSSNGLYYTGDDNPGANAPAGTLVGHFVQYTVPTAPGQQGNGTCTQGTFGDCIPVLTR
jgi:hypothetical protein